MANVASDKNPFPQLEKPPQPEEEEPLTVIPLDDSHLFEDKKVKIKEAETEPELAPIPVAPKKKKKNYF